MSPKIVVALMSGLKAVILYFPLMKMQLIEVGPFQFHDKIKLKSGYDLLVYVLCLKQWRDMDHL